MMQNFADNADPISTHAPLARCDYVGNDDDPLGSISTHAPLARCDKLL